MATFSTTTVATIGFAARPPSPQLRAARADTLRCRYSKEGLKACSAMNLSPAALKGLGLRRVCSKLVEEPMDTDDTTLRRLSTALNPERVLTCVLGYYIFFNPQRLQRIYDDNKSGGQTL